MEPKLILFQGDSITDAGRSRNSEENPGHGYPAMVMGALGLSNPGSYRFLNRGISGNRIVDLYARIKCDILNLKPDYMSILIGVNDVWHEVGWGNGVDAAKFEMVYDLLLTEIKAALPEIRLMLLEPFVLPHSVIGYTPEDPAPYVHFRKEVELRAAAAKRLAQKHGAVFVPLQEKLDQVNTGVPGDYWLADGVHPTQAGHALITKAWLEAFEQIR
jgi:lysophospholipase L1-like esterase